MKWVWSPQYCGWFIALPSDGSVEVKGYGPFFTLFECRLAGEVHGVPFTGAM